MISRSTPSRVTIVALIAALAFTSTSTFAADSASAVGAVDTVAKAKAKATATPSPKPAWPPKGFKAEGDVFAKVPTAKELVGLISANKYLEQRIKSCTTYLCAPAVQVVSEAGCIWWETITNLTDAKGVKMGELTNSFSGSKVREFKTLIVITSESLESGVRAKIKSVLCHRIERDRTIPGTSFKPEPEATNS